MLDGLFSTVADLNTTPFPDGDMSSQSERLNTYRQRVLGFSTTLAAGALDVEKASGYGQLGGPMAVMDNSLQLLVGL